MSYPTLYPHQHTALADAWVRLKKHKMVYLFGEPRIGKSLVALELVRKAREAIAERVSQGKPCKVRDIRPLFITKKGAREGVEDWCREYQVQLAHYEMLTTKYEELREYAPNFVILDEAHNFKCPGLTATSARWTALKLLMQTSPHCLLVMMSGTPAIEGSSDMIAQYALSPHCPFGAYHLDYTAELENSHRKLAVLNKRREQDIETYSKQLESARGKGDELLEKMLIRKIARLRTLMEAKPRNELSMIKVDLSFYLQLLYCELHEINSSIVSAFKDCIRRVRLARSDAERMNYIAQAKLLPYAEQIIKTASQGFYSYQNNMRKSAKAMIKEFNLKCNSEGDVVLKRIEPTLVRMSFKDACIEKQTRLVPTAIDGEKLLEFVNNFLNSSDIVELSRLGLLESNDEGNGLRLNRSKVFKFLHRITGGFTRIQSQFSDDNNKGDASLAVRDNRPKLAWLCDFVRDNYGSKVVVAAYYVNEQEALARLLAEINPCAEVVSATRSCEGVDLSYADSYVLYSFGYSGAQYTQLLDRVVNIKKTAMTPVYIPFIKGGIDDVIYEAVSGKRDFNLSMLNKSSMARFMLGELDKRISGDSARLSAKQSL